MEFFAFLGVMLAGAVALIWRSRRGTSSGPEALTKGLPDDLRDKYSSPHGGGGHIAGGGGGGDDGGGGGGTGGGF